MGVKVSGARCFIQNSSTGFLLFVDSDPEMRNISLCNTSSFLQFPSVSFLMDSDWPLTACVTYSYWTTIN